MHTRSIRFDDPQLQKDFVSELRRTSFSFGIGSVGEVTCAEADYSQLNGVAHIIRDRCFRWYFRWWKDNESAMAFWREMKKAGLPFQVEHHHDRIVFLLPRGSEDRHDEISDLVHEVK